MGSERQDLMRALGARLRGLRAEAGLTGAVLAQRAGVGQPTVSKVETGRMVPSADVLGRLSRALGLDASTAQEVRDLLVAVEAAPHAVEAPRRDDPRRRSAVSPAGPFLSVRRPASHAPECGVRPARLR
ncbi:helix-turn-helix domain-containing protein [Streptomyces antibioticus]|uniref:helix-turn-helix domain-containing protein n=1 Tax=Streptomyces antibioticus TaxID=1890 RepID=UPI003F4D6EBC